jgi:hypothetical protein
MHREGHLAITWTPQGPTELYDVSTDPGMLRDLAPEQEQTTQALRSRGEASIVEHTSSGSVPLDANSELVEKLRAMGYLAD